MFIKLDLFKMTPNVRFVLLHGKLRKQERNKTLTIQHYDILLRYIVYRNTHEF